MSGGNFVSGALSGFGQTMGILSALDEDKRRKKLWEQQDEDRARGIAREDKAAARGDTLWNQSQQDRDLALEDRERNIEREQKADARADQLFPIQLKQAKLAQNGQITQNAIARAQLKREEQMSRNQEAAGLVQEAAAYMEAGDQPNAIQSYLQLENFGFDVSDLAQGGGERAQQVVESIISKAIDIKSPEAQELAKKILTPAFVMSGRDPELFEVAGVDMQGGVFVPIMRNKKTGKLVPATDGMSDEDTDPVTTITPDEFMAAATSYIDMGAQMTKAGVSTAIKAKGARLGLKADKAAKPVSASEQLKQLELQERLAKPKDQERWETFVESYSEDSVERQIAMNMAADPATRGSVDDAADYIQEVYGIQEEFDSKDVVLSVQQALEVKQQRDESMQLQREEAEMISRRNPEISAEDARKIIEKLANPVNTEVISRRSIDAAVAKHLKKQQTKSDRDAKTAVRKADRASTLRQYAEENPEAAADENAAQLRRYQ